MSAAPPWCLRPLAAVRPAEVRATDVLVVGSGAAGMTVALGCLPRRVTLLTAGRLGAEGSSAHAQGGVAAALGAGDAPRFHAAETVAAGAGLADPEVAELLARGAAEGIARLLELGARFDRRGDGTLALGREAAHRRRRIVHARGDATGEEIVRVLTSAVRRAPGLTLAEESTAVDLVLEPRPAGAFGAGGHRAAGLLALDREGRRVVHLAGAVVLATGGLGGAYLATTNPAGVRGDGLAMAARAGVRLADLEFVQFHPTALAGPEAGGARLPLLTEALRGEGAVLIDDTGERFLAAEHPDAELAPRDVVARGVWRRLRAGHRVFLDAREAVGERFPERFPTVFESCKERGIDPRRELMLVCPAAHYHMGGVAADDHGRTSLPGLWACGEVASTGLHGANRLASNSLLETLVFGARTAGDVLHRPTAVPAAGGSDLARLETAAPPRLVEDEETAVEAEVRRLLWEHVGLVRSGAGLERALEELDRLGRRAGGPEGGTLGERNLLLVARLLAAAAREREESRGSHFREDFPAPDPDWRCRLTVAAGEGPWPTFRRLPLPCAPLEEVPSPVAVTATKASGGNVHA